MKAQGGTECQHIRFRWKGRASVFKFNASRRPILGLSEPLESNLAQSRESVDLALRRFHDGISREVSAYRDFATQLRNPILRPMLRGWSAGQLTKHAARSMSSDPV